MIADDASAFLFLLPPPAPPERKWRTRAIFFLSAAVHLGLLALFLAMKPVEPPPPPVPRASVHVLQGEVVTSETGDTGLRLFGYREASIGVAR